MESAQKVCRQQGADLVKVTSSAENNFIQQHSAHACWIGAVRNPVNAKQFIWMDGSSLDYEKWSIGQPDNDQESCTLYLPGLAGSWNDISCSANISYVCEKGTNLLNVSKGKAIALVSVLWGIQKY